MGKYILEKGMDKETFRGRMVEDELLNGMEPDRWIGGWMITRMTLKWMNRVRSGRVVFVSKSYQSMFFAISLVVKRGPKGIPTRLIIHRYADELSTR